MLKPAKIYIRCYPSQSPTSDEEKQKELERIAIEKSRYFPLLYSWRSQQKCHIRCYPSQSPTSDEEKQKELERIAIEASIDDPPTTCCQSGCANCVFIAWAEALSANMKEASPEIAEKILKMVEDPTLKAYLDMELRLRGLKK